MPSHALTLIGKPGCHLCDDARAIIHSVIADLSISGAEPIPLVEKSILDDPELFDRFVEDIPVVLIDGKVHTFWRVDPLRLRAALA